MTWFKDDGVLGGTVHIKCVMMRNVLKMHVFIK